MAIDPCRFDALLEGIAARVDASFFDETNAAYEAARLAHHRVIIVYWMDRSGEIHILTAKGHDEVMQYLNGESGLPTFEAFVSSGEEAASALRAAFLRLEKPSLRLVTA